MKSGMIKANKILRVDLSTGKIRSEEVPEERLNQFVGGKGLGAAYLYRELKEGIQALSPQNKLLFMLGPLVGLAPGCSRYCVVTKSPLTRAFLHSYSGGDFPSQLKFSLPDHLGIILEGKAEAPVYLKVDNGTAELMDGSKLKGKKTDEVCDHFKDYKVAAIGPAGENLVKFATISNDNGHHHAGRGGAGAVMGSKNLKAVIVRGEKPEVSEEIRNLQKEERRRLITSGATKGPREGGTPRLVDMINEVGAFPSRNWTKGSFEHANKINLDMVKKEAKKRVSCYNCPIACGFDLKMTEGLYKGLETGKGPEYETLGMVGANLEISDLSGVAKIGDLCNKLGMDTISTGNVIGWTMECSEKGLINYEIKFGDCKKAVELVEKIAYREDIGDMLAEGTRYAGNQVGGEAKEAAVEVKGLEPPAYDPRGSFSMGLAYATSDRGACHMRVWAIGGDVFGDRDPYSAEKGHAEAVIQQQNLRSLIPDSLVSCSFAGYTYAIDNVVKWLNVLGYDLHARDLELIGERIWNLTRMFNVREGFSRKDDFLPRRMGRPLKQGGPADGSFIPKGDLDKMLTWYYDIRAWDKDGTPSVKKLQELKLDKYL